MFNFLPSKLLINSSEEDIVGIINPTVFKRSQIFLKEGVLGIFIHPLRASRTIICSAII